MSSRETRTWRFRAALFAALGLAPLAACGGDDDGPPRGSGTGGDPGGGGSGGWPSCKVDGDCASGERCAPYETSCTQSAYACTTPGDACGKAATCPIGQTCVRMAHGFACSTSCVQPGRPFLVDGSARVARVTPRSDWCSSRVPDTTGLAQSERAALAAHWTEAALMEHASIAAFARFALELMSLGAPASLIAETHAAMADETVHARDAFGLASAYRGERIGPGAFDAAATSLSGRTVEAIVHTAILEGCIGETVAAVEAAEALAGATDPAVRDVLAAVAGDEARHAALAWRFVQWAITEGTAELRGAALSALGSVAEVEVRCESGAAARAPACAAHGMLDDAARAEIRRRVLTDVVAPCATALRRSWRSEMSAPFAVA